MIDTTEHEPEDGLHAFVRYVPRRIAAFEKRILRYRFEGWDPRGMAVLGGDVRRLADASGRYGLADTHHHLMGLAQMVADHLANMRALDPQHAQRMFAALSAVMRSLPTHEQLAAHGHHEAAPPELAREAVVPPAAQEAAPAEAHTQAVPAAAAIEAATDADQPAGAAPAHASEDAAASIAEASEFEVAADASPSAGATLWGELAEISEPTAWILDDEPVEPVADARAAETSAKPASGDAVDAVEAVAAPAPIEEPAAAAEAGPAEAVDAEEDAAPPAIPPAPEPVEAREPEASAPAEEAAAPAEPFVRPRLMETDETDESEGPAEAGMRRIYHLNDGSPTAVELGQRLEAEGYAIEPVETLEELSEFLLCLMPQLLLVDPSHLPELQDIAALRRDAQQRSQPPRRIQMAVMAPQDNLETRRAAHRAGADLLLFPPFDVAQIQARLGELYSSVSHEKVRVLIVEDDRVDALFAQAVLAKAGMQAYVEHDPLQVLDTLKAVRPDLVLMDLHMPYANGVEATMLIREHPLFAHVPIVFLSGESDPDSRLEAINAGGDDFLFKPIRPRNLVAAVQDRVRRMHRPDRTSAESEIPGEAVGGA